MGPLFAATAVVAVGVALGVRALITASEELIETLAERWARPKVPECRVVQRASEDRRV